MQWQIWVCNHGQTSLQQAAPAEASCPCAAASSGCPPGLQIVLDPEQGVLAIVLGLLASLPLVGVGGGRRWSLTRVLAELPAWLPMLTGPLLTGGQVS